MVRGLGRRQTESWSAYPIGIQKQTVTNSSTNIFWHGLLLLVLRPRLKFQAPTYNYDGIFYNS